ncbi:unnamed protein product [Fusarium graminearum]|uniref:Chromosome 1, complete genome n=1 Tax=Gibberella zeae (strain ATCC MYA-4620 / CBS 123657 / FGSC 9075 / NRRL 31084 / PH-1) TaxID=229533 RepID=A0A0E0RMN0_GIBZE|nr:hypothetical protein FG05_30615 [Fusarium graminearum]CEF72505.1 unnamed protein product [Fusarium graminearum]CZS75769.1 unnamed protein product [Fusarium graminearum]
MGLNQVRTIWSRAKAMIAQTERNEDVASYSDQLRANAKRSLDEMPKMEGSKAMGQLVAGSTKVEASLYHPSTSRGALSLY